MGKDTSHLDAKDASPTDFEVGETHWGYFIAVQSRTPSSVAMFQALAYFLGIGAAMASVGLWLMPGATLQGDVVSMKIAVSVVFGAAAILLFWFSSRGIASEMQVDVVRRELREAVRSRSGAITLVGRTRFDEIESVFLSRDAARPGTATLRMRFKGGAHTLDLVTGPEERLTGLKDRLGRDLLAPPPPMPRKSAQVLMHGRRPAPAGRAEIA